MSGVAGMFVMYSRRWPRFSARYIVQATPNCRRFDKHPVVRAAARACPSAGISSETRSTTRPTTTSNSVSVNPVKPLARLFVRVRRPRNRGVQWMRCVAMARALQVAPVSRGWFRRAQREPLFSDAVSAVKDVFDFVDPVAVPVGVDDVGSVAAVDLIVMRVARVERVVPAV